tara:strand:+ start:54 stop:566 length:513 start_codon:yes stop_codon:yes gene_type:complete
MVAKCDICSGKINKKSGQMRLYRQDVKLGRFDKEEKKMNCCHKSSCMKESQKNGNLKNVDSCGFNVAMMTMKYKELYAKCLYEEDNAEKAKSIFNIINFLRMSIKLVFKLRDYEPVEYKKCLDKYIPQMKELAESMTDIDESDDVDYIECFNQIHIYQSLYDAIVEYHAL